MFEDHPSFVPPDDESISVWRYVDMTKLVSLISSSAVAFVRADLLGDEWEGAWTQSMVAAREEENRIADLADIELRAQQASALTPRPINAKMRRDRRQSVYFSCWFMSESEDAAMWRIYGGRGIALRSTFRALGSAIRTDGEPVFAGVVQYVDYESGSFEEDGNSFTAYLYKRAAFAYERELRLAVQAPWTSMSDVEERFIGDDGQIWVRTHPAYPPAREVKAVLGEMLKEVVLAPDQPAWSEAPIRALLDRFGLQDVPLSRSKLGESPRF